MDEKFVIKFCVCGNEHELVDRLLEINESQDLINFRLFGLINDEGSLCLDEGFGFELMLECFWNTNILM